MTPQPRTGPQIATTTPATTFADLSRKCWHVVARRPVLAEAWAYYWPIDDVWKWRRAVLDGSVLVVQRYDPGGMVVALGRVAGLAPTRPARHAAPTAQPLRSHHGYQA